jgi:ubiquitin carboxyl-terminal hydrolase 7
VIDERKTSLVGLLNQGGTCYLNSLLQCLFHDTQFRNAIYRGNEKTPPITYAMQKLFACMQLSLCSAIRYLRKHFYENTVSTLVKIFSTRDLSTAFGWSRSQVFEQHDVHELFSVLVDALSKDSTELQDALINMYQGTQKGFNFII